MVKPSLANLMEKENVNRYALVVATAKCARQITDDYVRQREYFEKNSGKDSDKSIANVVNVKYRDEKAVKNAIDELYNDDYRIIKSTLPEGMGREDEPVCFDEETENGTDADTDEHVSDENIEEAL